MDVVATRPPAAARAGLDGPVTVGVSVLVSRAVALYTLLVLAPAAPVAVGQLHHSAVWWDLLFGVGIVCVLLAMVAVAFSGRRLRWSARIFALLTLLGVVTGNWAFEPAPLHSQPWIWWVVGPAAVAVGLVGGRRVAITYSVVLAALYGILRMTPQFGAADHETAFSEAVFATIASLAVVVLAVGMVEAARAADLLADQVYQSELEEAVNRAVGEERGRLDRLIHDDVMTTLTSAVHASDPSTVSATAELARETTMKIDALQIMPYQVGGRLSLAALSQLAADTVVRVSPSVQFDGSDIATSRVQIPLDTAEVVLAATREAVRNAVRHGQGDTIGVTVDLLPRPVPTLAVVVSDNGLGFDPDTVRSERLGLTVSIRRALASVGAEASVESKAGIGTTVTMLVALPVQLTSTTLSSAAEDRRDQLPARFPARQLAIVVWVVVAVELLLGVLNRDRVDPLWPYLAAMPVMIATTLIVVRPGQSLRLRRLDATLATAFVALIAGLVSDTFPRDRWPDAAQWHMYPLQLIIAAIVVRGRRTHAVVATATLLVCTAWWTLRSEPGAVGLLRASFGPVAFLAIAIAVTRVLGTLAQTHALLHSQELLSLDDTARRQVGTVQRSLWLTDLKDQARGTLDAIAASRRSIGAALKQEAALLEAELRESIRARNVMSDELAGMTTEARRRGVTVDFVDSRENPVPTEVGRAVIAEVRDALTSQTVSRLVVRLGPEGRRTLASVVREDMGDTEMVSISSDGNRTGRDQL